MTLNNHYKAFAALSAIAIMTAACSETSYNESPESGMNVIRASIANPAPGESRTAVDDSKIEEGVVGIMWTDGDELGVFDAQGNNHTRYVKLTEGTVAEADFGSTTGSSFMPKYAYYPYNATNDGRAITSLTGTIPATQEVGTGNVPADYKIGRMVESTNRFVFQHLFSLVRIDLDAAGTVLAGEQLEYVKFTANGANIAGDFNFNLRRVTYTNVSNASQTITVKWPQGTKLDKVLQEYISIFPTVGQGTQLDFEIKTANYTASFTATSQVPFQKEQLYNIPLSLLDIHKKYSITVKDKDGNDVALEGGQTPPEPEVITGTFTCAALNVDGLPAKVSFVNVNPNGPQSEGTKKISQAAANAGWDFFAVSEDFNFDTELNSALGEYNHGTYLAPGDWSIFANIFTTKYFDIDGLNLYWKKDGISAANETRVRYNDMEGRVDKGANTCIRKGFRHYEVTVAEGVIIDVYITHMNTYSGSGTSESNAYWKAQKSQLRQLRDYVVAKAKENNRPALIMGDTNMRYTRHSIKEQFIDYIADQGLTANDPWVEFHRPDYPAFGNKSLMINSKFYKDEKDSESGWYDTKNDICCYDNNKGEVVDKIFYVNVPGAPLQLKATSYKNDDSDNFVTKTDSHNVTGITYEDANFTVHENYSTTINKRWGLADHFPAVASFTWTLIK